MERKIAFVPGEHYHVFSRGVEKRKIFQERRDYLRFLALLYILNQKEQFHLSNFLKRDKRKVDDVFEKKRDSQLVSILAYSLMPNHFHLLIRENEEGGISKFMGKLLTAYSMYFNIKNERSGPLFVRPFRSSHAENDTHFRHLFSYIHLNCLDLHQSSWKSAGIADRNSADRFLNQYRYSSYPYFVNSATFPEHKILDQLAIPDFVSRAPLRTEDFEGWYAEELEVLS